MTDYLTVWQCIGCGRIEASRSCIGVWQDQRVRLVHAEVHEAVLERAQAADDALALIRKLAGLTPRQDRWRDSFLAVQKEARRLIAA